jgi:5-methylthioadenosine/S-adenosylhomocysteine deaminase
VARRDVFDEAYGRGVTRPVRRPPRSAVPRVRDVPLDAGAALPEGLVSGGPGSGEPTAFGGSVLKSDGSIACGWVVVEAGQIVSVRSTKPRDVEHAISTGGVILPGLIDLHGHPEYNVFAAWEPPRVYINRGRWRDSDEYDQLIKKPWATLTSGGKSVSVKTAMTRYAEVRAAVGGVTAIQGASQDYPNKAEALVRNVDLLIFGSQVARSTVDVDRLDDDEVDKER